MVDVLLSSDSVDVLGGAPTVNVDVNLGLDGQRGSRIFIGPGVPSSNNLPETPLVFDMYINLDPSSSSYLFLYQYLNKNGTNQWVQLLRLVPNTFLTNYSLGTFTAGTMAIDVPVLYIIPLASIGLYDSSNFNIQHTVITDKPVASSITVDDLTFKEIPVLDDNGAVVLDENGVPVIANTLVLPIEIHAAELNGVTWQAVTGNKTVHLGITIV